MTPNSYNIRKPSDQTWTASLYMLSAVFCYSWIPLVIALTGGADNPFLFSGAWRLGALLTYVAFLKVMYGPLLNRDTFALIARRFLSAKYRWLVLLTFASTADYALFALSVRFIDVPVTAVLFELWPIVAMLVLARLYGRSLHPMVLWLAIFCFLGFVFIASSQAGGFTKLLDSLLTSPTNTVAGFVPVITAVALTGLSACALKSGSLLADDSELTQKARDKNVSGPIALFGTVITFVVSNTLTIPPSIGFGLFFGATTDQPLHFSSATLVIVLGGATLALGAMLWQRANETSDNPGINAMVYLTPVVALILLSVFSQIGDVLLPYLVIGTAAIISCNLLINFEAERLLGFKALVVSLWTCGTIIYLRDVDQGLWAGDDYFSALTLAATVFTLILSFRVARLSARIQDEDDRAFRLIRQLEGLARRSVIRGEVCGYIITINEASGPELYEAYDRTRQSIEAAIRNAEPRDQEKLIALKAELDSLAHSRQRGIDFGELSALVLFAGLILLLALLARPSFSGVTAFLVDIFSMLFSTVIVFLTFSIGDLQRDRIARIMHTRYALVDREYEVVFQDDKRRHIEQGISIMIGLLLVGTFSSLLAHKWLGWFG